jgi:hypothetical protein
MAEHQGVDARLRGLCPAMTKWEQPAIQRLIIRRHLQSPVMPAFVWNTNHLMWKVVPPFTDSLAVLKAYLTDPSCYVYWSTPRATIP